MHDLAEDALACVRLLRGRSDINPTKVGLWALSQGASIIPIAAECDRDSKFPMDVFKAAWEIGLVNPCIPDEYGGSGMGELEDALWALVSTFAVGLEDLSVGVCVPQFGGEQLIVRHAPRPSRQCRA